MILYKHRALHFGGVHDVDASKQAKARDSEQVVKGKAKSKSKDKDGTEASTFYNDLHVFDLEHRRWYEMPMREPPTKDGSRRRRKPKVTNHTVSRE